MSRKSLAVSTLTFLSSLAAMQASALQFEQIGLTGADYTASNGYQFTQVQSLNALGQVAGYSRRFDGGTVTTGQTSWIYDSSTGTTTQVGLFGAGFVSAAGNQSTLITRLTDTGYAIGNSDTYSPTDVKGSAAWVYDGSTTTRIGLLGTKYTAANGLTYSRASFLADNGHAGGYSYMYDTPVRGTAAWVYDGSTTQRVGLIGAAQTRDDGYQNSAIEAMNNSGLAIGRSERYSGSTFSGYNAWLFDGSSTIALGLTGGNYTSTNGDELSNVSHLNEQGDVLGYSRLYNGTASSGGVSWIYKNGVSSRIDLVGSEFTRADGFTNSANFALNSQGQAAGRNERYDGSDFNGWALWFYNGTSTSRIGFTDSDHTLMSTGWQSSTFRFMNDNGDVAGDSARYNNVTGNYHGQSAWIYSGGATQRIGLFSGDYAKDNGYTFSEIKAMNSQGHAAGTSELYVRHPVPPLISATSDVTWYYDGVQTKRIGLYGGDFQDQYDGFEGSYITDMNDQGQVVGFSYRYYGSTGINNGRSTWFYDYASDQTFDLTLSTDQYGKAYSYIEYLGEDGMVLGWYTKYDQQGNDLGDFAFYFSMEDGVNDLSDLLLLDGVDIASIGWSQLAEAIQGNGLGQIIGNGSLSDGAGSQAAFFISPVPVPGALWLFASAVLAMAGLKRRH